MKHTLKLSLSVLILAVLAFFAGCTKKGDPGPAGADGTNGTNGTTGVGFDEAVKNGNIVVYFDGKRPDGVAFKDTIDFRFAPASLDYSSVYVYDVDDNDFYVRRYSGMDFYIDSEESDDNYADMDLEVYTGDGTNYYLYLDLRADISTAEFKYFQIDNYLYNTDGSNYLNENFSGYSYDPGTGKFKVTFSCTIDGGNNETTFPLNVKFVVDATVYEQIYGDRTGGKVVNGKKLPVSLKLNLHR